MHRHGTWPASWCGTSSIRQAKHHTGTRGSAQTLGRRQSRFGTRHAAEYQSAVIDHQQHEAIASPHRRIRARHGHLNWLCYPLHGGGATGATCRGLFAFGRHHRSRASGAATRGRQQGDRKVQRVSGLLSRRSWPVASWADWRGQRGEELRASNKTVSSPTGDATFGNA